ncbi:MAG: hypothetical protein M3Z27_05975 [Actinomycetota bacterium]|nr:hypothetical protein [Actinomycetota bacterium]
MKRILRFTLLAVLAGTLLIPAAGATAATRHKSRCSSSTGVRTPRLLSPCNRATLVAGHPVTFKIFAKSVRGHHGLFTLTPRVGTFPGYWLVTPGKYYLQIQQIDGRSSRHGIYYSPVYTLAVR